MNNNRIIFILFFEQNFVTNSTQIRRPKREINIINKIYEIKIIQPCNYNFILYKIKRENERFIIINIHKYAQICMKIKQNK